MMEASTAINKKKKTQVKKNENSQLRDVFFTVTDDDMPNNYDNFVNSEFNKISTDMLKIGSPKALKILLDLHEKYPNIPEAINNIAACYQSQGKMDKVEEFLAKLNRTSPDYLFARIARATKAMRDGRGEEIPSIFNNCFNLKDLYPERDLFHVTEVTAFSYTMGLYFCLIKDLETAQIYYDLLAQFADEDDARVKTLSFRIGVGRLFDFADMFKARGMKKRKRDMKKK